MAALEPRCREKQKEHRKDLIRIHMAVMLFGMSALFSRLIHQSAPVLTWGRVTVSSVFLFCLHRAKRTDDRVKCKKHLLGLFAVGGILAGHWSAFFFSAQVSTVAVATLTFSTFPVFVTFLEPWLFGLRLRASDVAAAFVMMFGVALIIPDFSLDNSMTRGILWGMLGSFLYALMSLANRRFAGLYPATVISFYEQGAAAVLLLPSLFLFRPLFSLSDLLLLLLLGTVFTGIAHSLFTSGMKTVRAQTAGMISGLESVYGILFAGLLLGEIPGIREIAGGAVILLVVFYSTKKAAS